MAHDNVVKTTNIDLVHSSATPDVRSMWRLSIASEWNARRSAAMKNTSTLFPLAMNPFDEDEILAMTEVLLTGRLTLGAEVEKAEKKFAQIVGVPYAVMVNSGSSANLLAVSAISNKLRSVHCNLGDHVLVPAVCWSTSVFPLIQNGLRPVFVDVDPRTFNVSLVELERKLTDRVKAVMAVHVLGNSINMQQMVGFVKRHNLILIEDTCESLGSYCNIEKGNERKMLGTFGDFGTFSFYFSHHITSGEGGMVTCNTEEDYNFVRCLRAHGWTRHLTNRKEVEELYPDIDSRFLFVNMGYNLRPLEVQGAMLSVQLDKLHQFNACRRDNLKRIREALSRDSKFSRLMSLMEASENIDPAWFGLGVLLHRPYAHQRLEFLKYLEKNGIENRPVISSNFIRQPCISAFCDGEHPENYPGAEAIHTRGFFIGIHQTPLDQTVIEKLVDVILAFPFSSYHVVLVTGGDGMLGKYIQDVVLERYSEENLPAMRTNSTPLRIKMKDSEWIFLTRRDGDLRKVEDVKSIFKRFQPTRLLHCAANLASVEEMSAKPVDFWLNNVRVNDNILEAAFDFQIWNGPIKVVSILSTLMLPKNAQFPIDASLICDGPPHPASESYAYAKRSLAQLIHWYRKQHNCNFVSVLSDDFFGAYADCNSNTASPINALIINIESRKEQNLTTPLTVVGTGTPLQKVVFAYDLAKIVIWALEYYNEDEPLIVAGQEISISKIAHLVCEQMGFTGCLKFDDTIQENRPSCCTVDTSHSERFYPSFKMTSLSVGIQRTVEWYRSNKSKPLKNS
jgi:CDP-6-deoxy-D-xylo-4-hexulose-3-dehydrase